MGSWHFNKNLDNHIYVRRSTLKELAAAIVDLEKRGYECTAPFQKVYKDGKKYDEYTNMSGSRRKKLAQFKETYDTVHFEVYMRRVKKDDDKSSGEE